MTVKELINRLKTVDQNKLVVLSSDEEGNSYNILNFIDDQYKYNNNGEIVLGDTKYKGTPCVVLFP